MFLWGKSTDQTVIKKADEAIAAYTAQKKALEEHKQQKMMRQVELWSILTPTSQLEQEYKDVAADIAFTIKKIICLEEHLSQIQIERYHCEEGSCERMEQLLAIPDPCANVSRETPTVNFQPSKP